MALKAYYKFPLGPGTEIYQNDYWIGDGSTKTFHYTNLTSLKSGDPIWIAGNIYLRSLNQWTPINSPDGFTLPFAPAVGQHIITVGQTREIFTAYDSPSIPSVSHPQQDTELLIIADIEEIGTKSWTAAQGQTGIVVEFVNQDPANGAQTTWMSLAPTQVPNTNLPGTFGAPGSPINLGSLQGVTTLNANASALATSISVTDPTQVVAGVIIAIDFGNSNYEEVTVQAISGHVLNVTPLTFSHNSGASIYECGWPLFGQVNVPTNAANGQTINLYNLSIDVIARSLSR